jgi:hypothetical protein
MLVLFAILAACRPEPVGSRFDDRLGMIGETDVDADEPRPDDVAMPMVARLRSVQPAVGDVDGGGGRVWVEVDHTDGIWSVTFGDAALLDLYVEDDTHVSGVLSPHEAGLVDVVATNTAGPSVPVAAFEYWTPAEITDVDVYLDAGKGVVVEGTRVAEWADSGDNERVFAQPHAARRPRWIQAGFGVVPAIQFRPLRALLLPEGVSFTSGVSIFAVARWTATTDTITGSAVNAPLTLVGDLANGRNAFGASADRIDSNYAAPSGPVAVLRGTDLNDGVARLIGATVDATTTTKIYVGNNQVGVDDLRSPIAELEYDAIGAGASVADGWDGDVGAIVIAAGELTVADRTKLDLWAQQRFGTPRSEPLDAWHRELMGILPLEDPQWYSREGAEMIVLSAGRVLMIGGWNPTFPWLDRREHVYEEQTDEVWGSDDEGLSWTLLLAHNRSPGGGAQTRFASGHAIGVGMYDAVGDGVEPEPHAVAIGSDPLLGPSTPADVWQESINGRHWTPVESDGKWLPRYYFMLGTLEKEFKRNLYLMGGQSDPNDSGSGFADVWRSQDGGVTWEELGKPPWTARGMVYRPVELDGKLYVVGGGLADDDEPIAFNGVFAFDGDEWTTVLPDGHDQWEATYDSALAVLDGRLWLFNGSTGTEDLSRALFSDDGGATWSELPGGSGGMASHGDAAVAAGDHVLRVSGRLDERFVWSFTK